MQAYAMPLVSLHHLLQWPTKHDTYQIILLPHLLYAQIVTRVMDCMYKARYKNLNIIENQQITIY